MIAMLFFKKRIKVRVFDRGDHFIAMASTKDQTVCNCYGSTREAAKEMAILRLKQAIVDHKTPQS
ncbi:hypothetical protein G6554_14775 [Bacillus sp. MM2020_4]|nr:hypothetical protein [Bacillus sp. MM2020_4]